ncbi:putative ATP-dependent endonuclease of OLD family [Paenibacillus sp. V4I3]|uniref:ATP-dependent nuclease n=1 Tax=Paenibacillus sp. V4I3 TaxID=3042305 RepID=UPI00278260F9|nr:AAA family ATPase [Paenibacillus sp. V4I3]MDQ0876136.1 putative ATP-dependent endonuclease of OLD family [Paenibacillus sp. V4I3]
MYLKELKIWNFRKYGNSGDAGNLPGLIVEFHKNFNLIIGENDAGKTAIIDAIKITLGTSSEDNYRISEDDFYVSSGGSTSQEIVIECIFTALSEQEAGLFLEWLSFDKNKKYELQVRFIAKKLSDVFSGERIERVYQAGPPNSATRLEGVARELIRATYLKPLRDAENELKPGVRSRLAQVLKNHQAFQKQDPNVQHELEVIFNDANKKVENFFDKPYEEGKTIKFELENYLQNFFHQPINNEKIYDPDFKIVQVKLNEILRKLSLLLSDLPAGLGSLNLLFIATELLLLNSDISHGANITLIEEIEAHLHPQAQLRLIKFLQSEDQEKRLKGQFILTTHSTTLAASTKLENIIVLNSSVAYPMGEQHTQLHKDDYLFLERFLDSTKANLFFAKGVIFVEGDAENLLLPTVAEILDRPLHRFGVSIVNIGNTAFQRYSKIFCRSEEWLTKYPELKIPVSIITDVDVRPLSYYENKGLSGKIYSLESQDQIASIAKILEIEDDDLAVFTGHVFLTKKEVRESFSLLNTELKAESYEVICSILENELSVPLLNSMREKKRENIIAKLEEDRSKIQVFVAPHWTLEYQIALSSIWSHLLVATHNLRYKKPTSIENTKKYEQLYKKLQSLPD